MRPSRGAFSSLSSISAIIRRSVAWAASTRVCACMMLVRAASIAALAAETCALADSSAALALSAAAWSSSSCCAETAPRCESVLERTCRLAEEFSSACRCFTTASVARISLWRWSSRAFAAAIALSASLICAAASSRCSLSTRVSIRASTSPWRTNCPSLTRMVSIRPAVLVAISTSVASILPLLLAKPSGIPGGRSIHHAAAAITTAKPITYPTQRRLILSIRDSLCSIG